MKNISILFLSIVFEALPFLLLGAFLSAIIERFVSEERMTKLFPKNIFLGSLVGVFLGFFLPACDCAVIPVSKKLIEKKVPVSVAVSFMLASPIINPVVLLSTYTAFSKVNMQLFYYRFVLGIIIAFIVGIIMGLIFPFDDVLKEGSGKVHCHCEEDEDEEFAELKKYEIKEHTFLKDIGFILRHTGEDLFDVLKFLMVGAVIASLIQVFLPRDIMMMFQSNKILSIFVLMVFAYLISLCSTSDSFVGRSLLSSFGSAGILGYLLLGPMIDIKNTIVLFGNYKKKFVFVFIGLIFFFVFLFSLVVGVL